MKTIVRLMLVVMLMIVPMLMIVAAPAYAGEATQMWRCELDDDITEEEVIANAQEWLKAAKTMKGGENLEAYAYFPVAVNNMGETDMIFMVTAPSFAEWGMFWDSYVGSPAAGADKENDLVDCPNSALWEAFKVE